jgi:hypothetical protein
LAVYNNTHLLLVQSVLGIILGGGAGTRLYPLTKKRAKPAVPLGANYRLIDIPVSNCLNSNISKIYVLTQFNSASLNRHLSRAYGSNIGGYKNEGFVEVLAAQQSPDNPNWFQVSLLLLCLSDFLKCKICHFYNMHIPHHIHIFLIAFLASHIIFFSNTHIIFFSNTQGATYHCIREREREGGREGEGEGEGKREREGREGERGRGRGRERGREGGVVFFKSMNLNYRQLKNGWDLTVLLDLYPSNQTDTTIHLLSSLPKKGSYLLNGWHLAKNIWAH